MLSYAIVPIIALVVLIGSGYWVYYDASANLEAGTPVVLSFGNWRIDSPQAWAIGCVVAWVLLFPIYLAARQNNL